MKFEIGYIKRSFAHIVLFNTGEATVSSIRARLRYSAPICVALFHYPYCSILFPVCKDNFENFLLKKSSFFIESTLYTKPAPYFLFTMHNHSQRNHSPSRRPTLKSEKNPKNIPISPTVRPPMPNNFSLTGRGRAAIFASQMDDPQKQPSTETNRSIDDKRITLNPCRGRRPRRPA